jgi:hypothetical protein
MEKYPFNKNQNLPVICLTDFTEHHFKLVTDEFEKVIEGAKYPWLQFEAKKHTASNYENTYPVSHVEGLRFVFKE